MRQLTACTLDCPDSCYLLVSPDAEGGLTFQDNPTQPVTAGVVAGKSSTFPSAYQARSRPVFLESPMGRVGVVLEEVPGLTPEAVICRRGDWMSLGGGVNRLIDARLTDSGEGAAYYERGVRLTNG